MFLGPSTYYYYHTKYGHYNGFAWEKTGGKDSAGYSTDQVANNVSLTDIYSIFG